jgi:hypothetical protein
MPAALDAFMAAAADVLDATSDTQLKTTLPKRYASPPTEDVASCLGLESLSDAEASFCNTSRQIGPNQLCNLPWLLCSSYGS